MQGPHTGGPAWILAGDDVGLLRPGDSPPVAGFRFMRRGFYAIIITGTITANGRGDAAVRIRLATARDDKMAISQVYEESWKSAYQGIIPQDYLDALPKGSWVKTLDNPARPSLIMLDGEKIVGVSSVGAARAGEMAGFGEIISIYLLPAYCGRGYGKQLLQAAVGHLVSLGFDDIYLWVLADNLRARRFYEQYGFQPNGLFLDISVGGKDLRELQYCYHVSGR